MQPRRLSPERCHPCRPRVELGHHCLQVCSVDQLGKRVVCSQRGTVRCIGHEVDRIIWKPRAAVLALRIAGIVQSSTSGIITPSRTMHGDRGCAMSNPARPSPAGCTENHCRIMKPTMRFRWIASPSLTSTRPPLPAAVSYLDRSWNSAGSETPMVGCTAPRGRVEIVPRSSIISSRTYRPLRTANASVKAKPKPDPQSLARRRLVLPLRSARRTALHSAHGEPVVLTGAGTRAERRRPVRGTARIRFSGAARSGALDLRETGSASVSDDQPAECRSRNPSR